MEYIIIFLLICVVSYYRNEKNDLEINLNDAHEKLKRVNSSDRYYREKLQEADSYYKNKLNETEMFCKSKIDMITAECNNRYAEIRQNEKLLRDLINSKVKDFPIVADVIAELKSSIDKNRSYYLEFKKRPAPKAAEMIMEVRREKKELVKQKLALEWEMKYIRRLLPWIDEIEDNPMEPINQSSDYYNKNYNMEDSNKDDIDNAGYWLTPKEYQSLTNIQKYQLALDRYNKRHKSNWEIGRDYERYIGYLFEQKGFKVDYTGIKDGFNDLGRDLICSYANVIYIVQCKCWSNRQGKKIHKKYINQLYGTTMMYVIEQQKKGKHYEIGYRQEDEDLFMGRVIPIFFSTVPFTDVATEFAKELRINLQQKEFEKYPMIKCNINGKGEKIYHLPFDQMYDKTIIYKPGEFYAMTVAEAESNGFRRAKRWLGN